MTTVALKSTPVLLQPAGSHWLELEQTSRAEQEPFAREELFPILELEAPRVGVVRAKFSAQRYVASNYGPMDTVGTPMWTDWHIVLREVITPDEDRPDLPHLGRDAAGIGPATRQAIDEACEPLIRAWLGTTEYTWARRKAAAYAFRRSIGGPHSHAWPPSYELERNRRTLRRLVAKDLISGMEAEHLSTMLGLLEQAAEGLEREPLGA